MQADAVIVAVASSLIWSFSRHAVSLHKNGSIAVDAGTGLAGTPRVYAGGDVVEGPERHHCGCATGGGLQRPSARSWAFSSIRSLPARQALSEQEIVPAQARPGQKRSGSANQPCCRSPSAARLT